MRIDIRNIIKGAVWGVLIPLLFMGCSFDTDIVDCGSTRSNSSDGDRVAYISVNFAAPNGNSTRGITASSDNFSTRANPTGGEWGDGRETGQSYENVISSAVVFLYQDNNGVNGSGSTTMKYVEYDQSDITGSSNVSGYTNIDYIATTIAKPVDVSSGTYHIIAVANPSSAFLSTVESKGNSLTLAEVRDYLETVAWVESGTTAPYSYGSFVMTSESDKTVAIDYNSKEDPATVTVDVERMAARVDYKTPSTIEIKEDTDNSIDGDDAFMGATIKITGAAIVNNLTAGSYMLKRVNTGKGTSVTYLGEETDTSGVSTNYVIDPWTEQKTGTVLNTLYGTYYPGTPATDEQKNPSYWDALVSSDNIVAVTDDDGSVWNRIGYTMENTTYSDYTSKQYASAVIFKALFTPTEGMVHDSFYSGYGFSYTNGTTFFKWNNNLYATPEDMMAAAYPGTFTLGSSEYGDRFAGKISSCTTWSEITTFANTLSEDDPTGYKNYLLSQASGKSGSLTDANKSVLTWDYYMKEEIGYTIITSGTTVTGFNIGTTTRAALADATNDAVGTYEDAQCYYTWWIRHSNDDNNDTNGTMEFAIVRNNMYKLEIASAFSIGGDIPTEGIHVVVTVKTWLLYDTDVINL